MGFQRKICFFLCVWAGLYSSSAFAVSESWDSWVSKIDSAIQSSMDYEVVLEDVLGEAQDSVPQWDNDPRISGPSNGNRVNCMIWLQMVIAKVYASSGLPLQKALDHIRYFGGTPAFCLRKHYTDHWVELDPAPLVPVDLQDCTKLKKHHVKITLNSF